jgi:hypothetical protein
MISFVVGLVRKRIARALLFNQARKTNAGPALSVSLAEMLIAMNHECEHIHAIL